MIDNCYCVYKHIRLDTNEVFYIGIGGNKRPYTKSDRNNYWKNIVKKTNYEIQIFKENITWEEAVRLEIELISNYGRANNKTGILCNLTDGGEGTLGHRHSIKTREKMRRNSNIWNKGKSISEDHKLKLKKNSGMAKKVICTKTGKVWNSVVDCANENKIVSITLSQYLRGSRKNKTEFKFLDNE